MSMDCARILAPLCLLLSLLAAAAFDVVTSDEVTVSEPPGKAHDEDEEDRHGLTAVIVIFALLSLGVFGFVAYSQWRRKQRESQQARFIKLFEDEDFLDDELGLKEGL